MGGGNLPLGYDVNDRHLVVNEPEAEIVRQVFQKYLEIQNMLGVAEWLNKQGIHTKKWVTKPSQRERGGEPFKKNTVQRMLTNPIYLCKITHYSQNKIYNGVHKPIISCELWEQVQAVNGGALLKQRIINAVIYDGVQTQKQAHEGQFYRWLPSDAQNPDPEHQLLYGKVFRVGTGDKDGNMPGERYGCRCGIEWLEEAEMTAEEKMKAVDVKLGKETRLPPLNKADLERMGVKESKPVIWTKYSSTRSAAKHKDITVKEYNYLVGNSLYKHIYPVFRDRKNKNYWHFIGTPETGRTSAPVVLLDVEETKNAFEIVHVHRMEANSLRRLLRKILKKN